MFRSGSVGGCARGLSAGTLCGVLARRTGSAAAVTAAAARGGGLLLRPLGRPLFAGCRHTLCRCGTRCSVLSSGRSGCGLRTKRLLGTCLGTGCASRSVRAAVDSAVLTAAGCSEAGFPAALRSTAADFSAPTGFSAATAFSAVAASVCFRAASPAGFRRSAGRSDGVWVVWAGAAAALRGAEPCGCSAAAASPRPPRLRRRRRDEAEASPSFTPAACCGRAGASLRAPFAAASPRCGAVFTSARLRGCPCGRAPSSPRRTEAAAAVDALRPERPLRPRPLRPSPRCAPWSPRREAFAGSSLPEDRPTSSTQQAATAPSAWTTIPAVCQSVTSRIRSEATASTATAHSNRVLVRFFVIYRSLE